MGIQCSRTTVLGLVPVSRMLLPLRQTKAMAEEQRARGIISRMPLTSLLMLMLLKAVVMVVLVTLVLVQALEAARVLKRLETLRDASDIYSILLAYAHAHHTCARCTNLRFFVC